VGVSRRVSLAYANEAGRAVVAYGFVKWSLHKIVGTSLAGNPASGCVMRKLGLAQEGLLREHVIIWRLAREIALVSVTPVTFLLNNFARTTRQAVKHRGFPLDRSIQNPMASSRPRRSHHAL
jgi:hypothetical protein